MNESKDNISKQVMAKEKKIKDLKLEITKSSQNQLGLEERIYTVSIENKQKQDDKDMMLMLLPQIVKDIQKKPNNIKQLLNQIENDHLKAKISKILTTYKINYK